MEGGEAAYLQALDDYLRESALEQQLHLIEVRYAGQLHLENGAD